MEEGGEIKTLDYSLCIICQTESEERLVENPVSHETVLTSVFMISMVTSIYVSPAILVTICP